MQRYLPIGSVIKLKDIEKRIMICGWFQVKEDGTEYDYSGCMFPEGIINSDELVLFNDTDVETVFFIGMQDVEQMHYKELVRSQEEADGK